MNIYEWVKGEYVYFQHMCCRLFDIACDAELQEKSKSDLARVTNLVIDRCRQTLASYEAQTAGGMLTRNLLCQRTVVSVSNSLFVTFF